MSSDGDKNNKSFTYHTELLRISYYWRRSTLMTAAMVDELVRPPLITPNNMVLLVS